MMAVDFFSNSSSVKAGLVGVWGGGGVAAFSLFAVHRTTKRKNSKSDFKLHEGKKNKQKHCFHSYLLVNLQTEVN